MYVKVTLTTRASMTEQHDIMVKNRVLVMTTANKLSGGVSLHVALTGCRFFGVANHQSSPLSLSRLHITHSHLQLIDKAVPSFSQTALQLELVALLSVQLEN
jgi:hypothetical protein